MRRNDYINLRVSRDEKQRIAGAAQRMELTVADYVRAAAAERINMEAFADRLITTLLASLNDQSSRIGNDLHALAQRVGVTATRDDLRKLSEWLDERLRSTKGGHP
jgi:hypothetical protein